MANILDQYWKGGGFMTADDFADQSVPGAATGVDPAALQEPVAQYNDANAQQAAMQVESLTKQQDQYAGTLTDEQRAAKEAQAKVRAAQDAEMKVQQAAVKEQRAKEDLLPPDAVSSADAPVAPEPVTPEQEAATAQPQGAELVAKGYEDMREGVAQTAGVAGRRAELSSDMIDTLTDKTFEELDQVQEIADQRQNVKAKLAEIDSAVQAEMGRDIKKPSPSALNLIGVLLGGLIAPMQGGRNVALETVQRQMDREVQIEMENKRKRMQGLQKRRGLVQDESAEVGKEMVAADLIMAKKLKAFGTQLQAGLDSQMIPAEKKAEMTKLLGEINVAQGQFQMKASREISRVAIEKYKAETARMAKRKSKGGGGKGGGGKGSGKGVVAAAKASPLYFDVATGSTVDFNQLPGKEQTRARKELAQIPMVDKENGTVMRGIRGLRPEQAKQIQKAWGDRNKVRTGTQRILALLNQVDGSDRLVIGGASKTAQGGQLQAEFTQLMVALKDQWELGAIQKPDERLLEGAMGANPTDAFAFIADKLNVNQIEAVMQNLQSGGNLRMKTSILSEAGLPDSFEIKMPRFDATSDIEQRHRKQAPASVKERKGNATEALGALNDFLAAPEGIAAGDKKEHYGTLQGAIDDVVKPYIAGIKASAGGKSGGVIGKGDERMFLEGMLKKTTDKRARLMITKGLSEIHGVGLFSRKSEKTPQQTEKERKTREKAVPTWRPG
tara:strand:+ start:21931 stop:24108 length:2178 start_codon:yes stop_codon:yes gene_type:complete